MKALLADRRGAAALEFAFVSTALMLLVFGVMEMGRMLWTRQALQGAAAETARCLAIGSPNCPSGSAYAESAAADRGISDLQTGMVVVAASDPCGSTSGTFTKVTITYPYAGVVPSLIPTPAGGLSVSACFPH
jgi:Flp pilus assembly protein TadG